MLLGCKKEERFTLVIAWMDPENIMLSEISQSEKDKYHIISLICGKYFHCDHFAEEENEAYTFFW